MSSEIQNEEQRIVEAPTSAQVAKRVYAADKRMINATTDVNQLVPFKYKWAWDMYLNGSANNWMPMETDLRADADQWQTVNETDLFITLRYLQTLEDANAGTLTMGIYRHVTAPEARQYLLRQGFEEVLRSHTLTHVSGMLDVDVSEIPVADHSKRSAFTAATTTLLSNALFATGTFETNQAFLKAMVVYGCLMKGVFGLTDATRFINLGQVNKLPGVVNLARLILRDQVMHCAFAVEVIDAIKVENPELWSSTFVAEITALFREALAIEVAYAEQADPANASNLRTFLYAVGNRRSQQMGLGLLFPLGKNPYPWMGEMLGLRRDDVLDVKVVENKVTGTLDWD